MQIFCDSPFTESCVGESLLMYNRSETNSVATISDICFCGTETDGSAVSHNTAQYTCSYFSIKYHICRKRPTELPESHDDV